MGSVVAVPFAKTKTCPPADVLLRVGQSAHCETISVVVSEHLAACDFCGAERELLRAHAPTDTLPEILTPPMPEALYRLALDLLSLSPRIHQPHELVYACAPQEIPVTDA